MNLQEFTGEEVISKDVVPKLNNNFDFLDNKCDDISTNLSNLSNQMGKVGFKIGADNSLVLVIND